MCSSDKQSNEFEMNRAVSATFFEANVSNLRLVIMYEIFKHMLNFSVFV